MKKRFVNGSFVSLIALVFSFFSHSILVKFTYGLWTIKEGAPWPAILAVFVIPTLLSFAVGFTKNVKSAIKTAILSPFIVAIVDYFTCIIIGMFLSGDAVTFAILFIVLVALLAGPTRIIIVFIE